MTTPAERLAEIQAEQEKVMGEIEAAAMLQTVLSTLPYGTPFSVHFADRPSSSFEIWLRSAEFVVTVTAKPEPEVSEA